MDTRRQWLISVWFVIALTIGGAIMKKLVGILSSYHLQTLSLISPLEGGVIIAIEMGVILILGLIGFTIPMKIQPNIIMQLAWKVLLLALAIGFIIGVTYTAGLQSISCGFLHTI